MTRVAEVETKADRRALAADAGYGRISLGSVVTGTLVAYGAFAVLVALAAAAIGAAGSRTDVTADNWRQLGVGGGIAVAVVLFVSYLYGGYVAGRMARRSGAAHGLLVFFLGLLAAIGIGALVNRYANTTVVTNNLRSMGLPTRASDWRDVGTVAGIASLAAMFLGSLLGGIMGERWHTKLFRRAVDGTRGGEHGDHMVDDGQPVLTRTERDEERAGHRTAETRRTDDADMVAAPTID
jgi:hypothetical protein